ncbi:hypothetical protein GGX14DRAFT_667129 [Mycena pura]|uniref:DUF6535 domain-containing protein n=1 Tax=Mycena pura TaxID=153505 RepID=A0AAD6Y3V3_9AGAR|nr:hypothetical protein GGX14DRAFT_667129 [Mycena pura]
MDGSDKDGRALSPQAEDATKVLTDSIRTLSSIIEEQISLLRRIEQRRELSDKSRQPIPEVPATSGSAWNALLQSTLTDTIYPKVDGWRSGLDALLVFLGLFSGIVTAFIVQSLGSLKQDEVGRTNEILSNLTSIVIAVSGANPADLNLTPPLVFVPAASDVRLNAYLTLSLVVSLAIAALAITCRGFLNLVSWSRSSKAVQRLTDIRTRWKSAERLLGPAVESLPQLLVIPVLLFLVGLLDSVFSTALQISSPPVSVLVTSGLSLLFVAAVAIGLCFTIINGSLHPTSSPFQSRTAHILNVSYVKHIRPILRRMRTIILSVLQITPPTRISYAAVNPPFMLSPDSMDIYHEILQATGDDQILDDASAALFQIIGQRIINQSPPRRMFKRLPVNLLPQECATLVHLLSPEASVRSNRTAAQVIVKMASSSRTRPLRYSQNDLGRLLPSLSRAARRATSGDSLLGLWDSEFLRAMGIVAHSAPAITAYPPAIVFLGASHWSWKYLVPIELSQILSLLFEVIDEKLNHELENEGNLDKNEALIVDSVLSTSGAQEKSEHMRVTPRNIFASLLYLPHDVHRLVQRIIPWLVRAYSPTRVIVAAHAHMEEIQRSEWLHVLGQHGYAMVPRLVAELAECCLATVGFAEHASLAQLCALCLLYTPGIRAPAGFDLDARPVLNALLMTLADVDLAASELSSLLNDVLKIKKSVNEDLLWTDGKDAVLEQLRAFAPSVGLQKFSGGSTRPVSPGGAKYEAAEAGLCDEGVDVTSFSVARQ